jgi:chromosome partitioning protein
MAASLRESGLSVVTIANQKGGVGKTASVIQIASGLAKRGEKVLVIDGDPQGNLSLFFGAKSDRDFGDLISALRTETSIPLPDYLHKRVRRNLDLLPARNRNLRLSLSNSDISEAAKPFSAFIASVRSHYDWVILDSSPSNSPLERLLIRASDAVIIPLEFQLFSVAGLEAILEEVKDCSSDAGKEIFVHSLIFTKAENRLSRVNTYREVFSSFSIPIFEICKSEYISRSLEKSRTIWECGPSSYAARDYSRVIEKGFLEIQ